MTAPGEDREQVGDSKPPWSDAEGEDCLSAQTYGGWQETGDIGSQKYRSGHIAYHISQVIGQRPCTIYLLPQTIASGSFLSIHICLYR